MELIDSAVIQAVDHFLKRGSGVRLVVYLPINISEAVLQGRVAKALGDSQDTFREVTAWRAEISHLIIVVLQHIIVQVHDFGNHPVSAQSGQVIMVGAVIAYNMSFINHSSHKVRTGSCVMHIDDKNTLNIFFLQGVQDGGGKVVVLVSKSKCQIDLFLVRTDEVCVVFFVPCIQFYAVSGAGICRHVGTGGAPHMRIIHSVQLIPSVKRANVFTGILRG